MGLWERVNRWENSHRFAIDATLTGLAMLVTVPFSRDTGSSADVFLWAAAVTVPLAWRRSRPVASAVTVYTVALLHLMAGHWLIFPADVAVLAALYSLTVHGPRWAHPSDA